MDSSTIYHGTYNSTLVMSYDLNLGTWTFVMSENLLDSYVPCAPTLRPSSSPSSRPSVNPTALPSLFPSASPSSRRPSVSPTVRPTSRPSNFPTASPTRLNNTLVQFLLTANYGDSWGGVKFLLHGTDVVEIDAVPSAGNNPLNISFLPAASGVFIASAVLPDGISTTFTPQELECMVSIFICFILCHNTLNLISLCMI